ncbi:MAG TPA: hypothetical protein PL078_09200 [Bacillota bacterium]|nr:hypothetical protein [Peptococcaceae bacterium MAG4]NLW38062.1 hypothetical protein [Peptococcaceae bacterium]HPZ44163.1 hypothetical protein [Bacillota bacterium]HQD76649.1 hypothetical protein [Bacillota bacterium]HUM59425.1 hypothetical protein [Bacillota bacterium]
MLMPAVGHTNLGATNKMKKLDYGGSTMSINVLVYMAIFLYLVNSFFIAWFIWTDRKIIKITTLQAAMWIVLCISMVILVPVYIYYRKEKLL